MAWHLKDRELEKKLIAIDPNFVKTLTDTVEEKLANNAVNDDSVVAVELTYNGVYFGMVSFFTNRLEEVHEYNPKVWNKFTAVKPPYNVMMRVDFENYKLGFKAFYKHFEGGDCWCYPDGSLMPKTYSDHVRYYRPWDD